MVIDPSEIVYWQWGFVRITATLVFTWITMLIMVVGAVLTTRNLSSGPRLSHTQNAVEAVILTMKNQIREVSRQDPGKYLSFIGTLFLFILIANILSVVPGYHAPTGSLNTTIALALCVFFAVPAYGIANQGLRGYLRQYIRPSVVMLPFNIIGEFSRTLSLAVRLYGNMMSISVIIAILLSVIPLFFPVVVQAFGLLTGLIQAYIFAVLAIVYIASSQNTGKKDNQTNA